MTKQVKQNVIIGAMAIAFAFVGLVVVGAMAQSLNSGMQAVVIKASK